MQHTSGRGGHKKQGVFLEYSVVSGSKISEHGLDDALKSGWISTREYIESYSSHMTLLEASVSIF